MLVVTSRIEARPAGRRELAQALLEWVDRVRPMAEAHLYEDLEPPHMFCVITVWPTAAAFANHIAAPEFGSVVGAVELLASGSTVLVAEGGAGIESFPELRRLTMSAPPASRSR